MQIYKKRANGDSPHLYYFAQIASGLSSGGYLFLSALGTLSLCRDNIYVRNLLNYGRFPTFVVKRRKGRQERETILGTIVHRVYEPCKSFPA